MDREATIIKIKDDYANELKEFIGENPLLDESYFITELKLISLNKVIKTFEEVGEFFYGNDEFQYGEKALNRKLFGYYKLYRDFLNSRKMELETPTKAKEIKNKDFTHLGQPMNDKANELFERLIMYYRPEEKKSIKFINIHHYLKNDVDRELYVFNITQEKYKSMIKERFGIDIKKFAKSGRYFEKEKPVLNTIEKSF